MSTTPVHPVDHPASLLRSVHVASDSLLLAILLGQIKEIIPLLGVLSLPWPYFIICIYLLVLTANKFSAAVGMHILGLHIFRLDERNLEVWQIVLLILFSLEKYRSCMQTALEIAQSY